MPELPKILQTVLQVILIVLGFNLIIFVHELGHFLAGRWRGLKIDRFQIWFGKPIWKKTWNGVQYGLGWIPFGGFVSLPQMAPMESIEGASSEEGEPLPKISPLDKIIVAIAGPLFSLLLGLAAAGIVTQVGKPVDTLSSTVVGSVEKDSPAEKAGFKVGDKILQINGKDVHVFQGGLDGIVESIVLSKGDEIKFKVERKGEAQPLALTSHFEIQPTKWYQRRSLRHVGIGPEIDYVVVGGVSEGSPAQHAGLLPGDRLLTVDGKPVPDSDVFLELVKAAGTRPFVIEYERSSAKADAPLTESEAAAKTRGSVTLAAEVPESPAGKPPMVGIGPSEVPVHKFDVTHPSAWQQVGESLNMMWVTVTSLLSRDSNVGVDHLSSVVGIVKAQYTILQMDHPMNRFLAFFVLFNVNLAVLNMLPFPVLDGGHIVLATLEAIVRRPVKAKPLEWLQTVCALMLISLMLYVTSKDLFGDIGHDRPMEQIVFKKR